MSLMIKTLDAGGKSSPCGMYSPAGAVEGGLKDEAKLVELAKGCDVVTMEVRQYFPRPQATHDYVRQCHQQSTASL